MQQHHPPWTAKRQGQGQQQHPPLRRLAVFSFSPPSVAVIVGEALGWEVTIGLFPSFSAASLSFIRAAGGRVGVGLEDIIDIGGD
ncbi:hypothetical protein ACEPAG_2229 [Sanghuangporus baumii]